MCGNATLFSGFNENQRESGFCWRCGSFNRQRQIARVVRVAFGFPDQGRLRFADGVAIYNVESRGAIHRALRSNPGYTSSEFFGPEHKSGTYVSGIRHEDLQRLSFADTSFDLVVSSDVLEHLPDPYAAHREIFRVLKPNARHIFTVPYDPGAPKDDIRAQLVGTTIEYRAQQLYHGDPLHPDQGILVWRIFGREMLSVLREVGFHVTTHELNDLTCGIIGEGATVFEAVKPR